MTSYVVYSSILRKSNDQNKVKSKAKPVKKAKAKKGKKILLVAGHGKGAYSNDPVQ